MIDTCLIPFAVNEAVSVAQKWGRRLPTVTGHAFFTQQRPGWMSTFDVSFGGLLNHPLPQSPYSSYSWCLSDSSRVVDSSPVDERVYTIAADHHYHESVRGSESFRTHRHRKKNFRRRSRNWRFSFHSTTLLLRFKHRILSHLFPVLCHALCPVLSQAVLSPPLSLSSPQNPPTRPQDMCKNPKKLRPTRCQPTPSIANGKKKRPQNSQLTTYSQKNQKKKLRGVTTSQTKRNQ